MTLRPGCRLQGPPDGIYPSARGRPALHWVAKRLRLGGNMVWRTIPTVRMHLLKSTSTTAPAHSTRLLRRHLMQPVVLPCFESFASTAFHHIKLGCVVLWTVTRAQPHTLPAVVCFIPQHRQAARCISANTHPARSADMHICIRAFCFCRSWVQAEPAQQPCAVSEQMSQEPWGSWRTVFCFVCVMCSWPAATALIGPRCSTCLCGTVNAV